jgi:hypothetical protein
VVHSKRTGWNGEEINWSVTRRIEWMQIEKMMETKMGFLP